MFGALGAGTVGIVSMCGDCAPRETTTISGAVVAPALAPSTSGNLPVALPAASAAEVKTVRLAVEGMTCGGCVVGTRKVLTRLPGVTSAEVSYEKKEALVTYDSSKVTVGQMVAAVKTLGYTATVAPR